MEKLESEQIKAAYAVSGAWKGTSTKKTYKELGWEWLSQRWWYRRLTLFNKIVNKMSTTYLTYGITFSDPPWSSVHGRPTGEANVDPLMPFSSRTVKFQSFFFPFCVFSRNRFLTHEQRSAINIVKFKQLLLSSFKPSKPNNYSPLPNCRGGVNS